eukprot:139665_1
MKHVVIYLFATSIMYHVCALDQGMGNLASLLGGSNQQGLSALSLPGQDKPTPQQILSSWPQSLPCIPGIDANCQPQTAYRNGYQSNTMPIAQVNAPIWNQQSSQRPMMQQRQMMQTPPQYYEQVRQAPINTIDQRIQQQTDAQEQRIQQLTEKERNMEAEVQKLQKMQNVEQEALRGIIKRLQREKHNKL